MQNYFQNKKITLMGLGILGRGVGDAKFLAESGADLLITDLRSKDELKTSLAQLKKYKNIKYKLGGHDLADFCNKDLILKAASVPLDSIYIKKARKNKIPIKMSAALLAELSGAKLIGITGTRGKSTVTHLIYEIIKNALNNSKNKSKLFLAGNIRGIANLPILKKIKPQDIIIAELDSWQLQGFGEAKISPHISVFTTFLPDHLNYYKNDLKKYFQDKANIFKFQKISDYFITTPEITKIIKKLYGPGMPDPYKKIKSKLIIPKTNDLPINLKTNLLGEHNKKNIAIALSAAKICLNELKIKLSQKELIKIIKNFKPVPGRLEYLGKIKNIKIYNDNNATTPEATIAALRALEKNIILIMGGSDKNLEADHLVPEIKKHCKAVILLSGSGTEKIKNKILALKNVKILVEENEKLADCVKQAFRLAKKGDTILFSPAFASFGKYFKNEFDRGEQFLNIIKKF